MLQLNVKVVIGQNISRAMYVTVTNICVILFRQFAGQMMSQKLSHSIEMHFLCIMAYYVLPAISLVNSASNWHIIEI